LQAVRDDIEAGLVDRASGQYVADPNTLSGFIADRFRPEFRTAFAVWVSSRPLVNNEAAATPFELPQYILAADAEMLHSIEEAESQFHSASEANNRAENYVLLTVLFAIALVLAGIGSKLRRSGTRAFMVGLAFATMLAAGLVMATFPIEI
jgi:hypothetical protein